MRFCLPACDHDYSEGKKSGTVNGGTVWLDHIAQALRFLGHEAEMVPLTAHYEGDFVIIQSEWAGLPNLEDYKNRGGKVITLLGHFISHVYPKIETVKRLSDYLATVWEGELLEGFDAYFMPHGYNSLGDDGMRSERKGDIVWAGNSYQLRDEGWLAGLEVYQIKGTMPKELFPLYRGAKVCPGLHGDFQKNIVSDLPSKIADKPGMMINERFWNVIGCGGVLVSDWIPQMGRWFNKNELIVADNKKEYQELIKYYTEHRDEGLEKLKTAREKIRKEHNYIERVKGLLTYIGL